MLSAQAGVPVGRKTGQASGERSDMDSGCSPAAFPQKTFGSWPILWRTIGAIATYAGKCSLSLSFGGCCRLWNRTQNRY